MSVNVVFPEEKVTGTAYSYEIPQFRSVCACNFSAKSAASNKNKTRFIIVFMLCVFDSIILQIPAIVRTGAHDLIDGGDQPSFSLFTDSSH